ncbi:MAG TPA: right-handed parallel beta-helix repeat-containing protein, partial [Roseiflexaceae bacterium]|nr:right-handed parallel beta-helix repeat-containing protein [Roseiflexaceae bacterium]
MTARRSMLVIGLFALLVVQAYAPQAIRAAGNVVVTDCSNATQLATAATSPGVTQITFDCGAAPATIPITGYMSVQGDVTIDGGGKVTLDGGTTAPFFQVYAAGSLTLHNLTLQNGAYTGIHAIENFGATTLEHVVMRSNKSAGQGGAIANYATLTVRSSLFEGNQASTPSASGGAIYQGAGSATIETSTFSGNQSSGTGGAIACANGALTLTALTITGSMA